MIRNWEHLGTLRTHYTQYCKLTIIKGVTNLNWIKGAIGNNLVGPDRNTARKTESLEINPRHSEDGITSEL